MGCVSFSFPSPSVSLHSPFEAWLTQPHEHSGQSEQLFAEALLHPSLF